MKETVRIAGDNTHHANQIRSLAPSLGIDVLGHEAAATALSGNPGAIWVSNQNPPEGYRIWVRQASADNAHLDIEAAYQQRMKYSLDVVGILGVSSSGPVATFNIAVCGSGSLRSCQRENDLFQFLLEYAAGSV